MKYYVWDEGSSGQQMFMRFDSKEAAEAYAAGEGEVLSEEQLSEGERAILSVECYWEQWKRGEHNEWDAANEEHIAIMCELTGVQGVGEWQEVLKLDTQGDEFWERAEELRDDEQGDKDFYATLDALFALAPRMRLCAYTSIHEGNY